MAWLSILTYSGLLSLLSPLSLLSSTYTLLRSSIMKCYNPFELLNEVRFFYILLDPVPVKETYLHDISLLIRFLQSVLIDQVVDWAWIWLHIWGRPFS